jgi:hypothetical protein
VFDDAPGNDCNKDCNDVWGGEAFFDGCGVCSGGTTGHEPNSDQDDCGDCFGNNDADLGCGCDLPAALDYCADIDGDTFGAGNITSYCLADLPDGFVEDCTDPEPNCPNPDSSTLMIDACGDCSSATDYVNVDLGCGCDLPAALDYCADTDGDTFGAGDITSYCLADLPDGFVEDCTDPEPDCENPADEITGAAVEMIDACGDCSSATDYVNADLGCGCSEPAALNYWLPNPLEYYLNNILLDLHIQNHHHQNLANN